ncbi:4'-phosphopantetheinyl transferase family protein [Dokdonella soli]|uniref:Enterobactin synthase component D n=1 Tax=Dokdonella soli TaxID=529810 RepID=A0ABP3U5C0_9GAMM
MSRSETWRESSSYGHCDGSGGSKVLDEEKLSSRLHELTAGFIQSLESLVIPSRPEVSLLQCRYDSSAYRDVLYTKLGIDCPEGVRRAVRKRKAEHLAGRYLGQLLLRRHCLQSPIPIGGNRQPLWPEGWVGSITHTDSVAITCIADAGQVGLLGVDLERWLCDQVAEEISATLICSSEDRVLQGAWPRARALTLAFSAKESLFKAIYPVVGYYFNFDCVEIVELDWAGGMLALRVARTLSALVAKGDVFHAHFSELPDNVLTLLASGK